MAETISMPKLGFDMAEGQLVRWLKKVGETVNKGEVLAEIETDKATVEVDSTASGVVRSLLVDEGAVVPVNTPIAIVGTADENIETVLAPKANKPSKVERQPAVVLSPTLSTPVPVPGSDADSHLKVSPLARRAANEKRVDISAVKGTGPGGRIVRRDIEALASLEVPAAGRIGSAPPSPDNSTKRLSDQSLPMSKLRAAIGRRMAEAKTTIPHFYMTHEYKMDALMDLRVRFNKIVQENEKLSVNDFIIKATALALLKFPNLNASLNGSSVLHHGQVNIGVAVSVEGGLLTIVCRDADKKPLRQIAAEVKVMAARARDGRVKPDDIEGSTFSISNLGMYDVENFIAIINPPEAAILAVGSAREMAVAENGVVKPGWRMKATISVDHRVSDGVEAAKFMQALAVFLEEPLRLVV
ncbi:MAG TPA: dihydrolipoamide acetyltransferase family protein [Anaerolineales bacterium]